MKKLWLFLSMLFAVPVMAQNTVSATITDLDGNAWASGTYSISFQPSPSVPQMSGQTVYSGSLDGSGAFSISLPTASWNFQITPKASQGGFTKTVVITSTISLTATLSALARGPRFPSGPNAYGYADVEVILPVATGTGYFNVKENTQHTWNGAAWQASGSSSAVAPNMPEWYVSPQCGTQTNCTKVFADTQYVVDATSTSTTTVTCPDCNFTSADVGKVVWATTQGTGSGYLQATTFVCPQTTITAVNSATSITIGSTCTASGTANVVLIWGHDDGAALASLDAAVGCAVVHVATSNTFIMDGQPFLVNAPTGCNQQLSIVVGPPQPAIVGDGYGASQAVFVMTPNFNWSNCKAISGAQHNVCLFGQARSIANIQVWGTGLLAASNSNCANAAGKIVVSAWPPSSVIYGLDIAGICLGETGLEGIEVNSYDETFDLGGAQQVGLYACVAYSAKGMVMRGNDCRNDMIGDSYGLYVSPGAQLYTLGSYPLAGAIVGSGGTLLSEGSTYIVGNSVQPSLEVAGGGIFVGHEDAMQGLTVDSGGVSSSGTSNFNPNVNTNSTISNSGNFTDLGANTWTTNAPTTASPGVWQATSSTSLLFGSCRGTATSSTTLGLYGLGDFATQNCTSVVTNLGQPYRSIGRAGKVSTLSCNSGTGGVNASSGVVTVLKNGSSTSLTCTFGTGTSCQDNTHTDTPALGDVYSVQFTTQLTETLANVTCTVLAW